MDHVAVAAENAHPVSPLLARRGIVAQSAVFTRISHHKAGGSAGATRSRRPRCGRSTTLRALLRRDQTDHGGDKLGGGSALYFPDNFHREIARSGARRAHKAESGDIQPQIDTDRRNHATWRAV